MTHLHPILTDYIMVCQDSVLIMDGVHSPDQLRSLKGDPPHPLGQGSSHLTPPNPAPGCTSAGIAKPTSGHNGSLIHALFLKNPRTAGESPETIID